MGSVSDRDWGGYYTLRCKDITQRFKVVDSNIGYMHTCAQFVPYNWDSITVAFDLIAEKLGLDPVEVARRNLHGPSSQDDTDPVPSLTAAANCPKKLSRSFRGCAGCGSTCRRYCSAWSCHSGRSARCRPCRHRSCRWRRSRYPPCPARRDGRRWCPRYRT